MPVRRSLSSSAPYPSPPSPPPLTCEAQPHEHAGPRYDELSKPLKVLLRCAARSLGAGAVQGLALSDETLKLCIAPALDELGQQDLWQQSGRGREGLVGLPRLQPEGLPRQQDGLVGLPRLQPEGLPRQQDLGEQKDRTHHRQTGGSHTICLHRHGQLGC